jgi:hypothetical protein
VRTGAQASGVYFFQNAGYVDVAYAVTCEANATNFQVESNGIDTRFYGHRLF